MAHHPSGGSCCSIPRTVTDEESRSPAKPSAYQAVSGCLHTFFHDVFSYDVVGMCLREAGHQESAA